MVEQCLAANIVQFPQQYEFSTVTTVTTVNNVGRKTLFNHESCIPLLRFFHVDIPTEKFIDPLH